MHLKSSSSPPQLIDIQSDKFTDLNRNHVKCGSLITWLERVRLKWFQFSWKVNKLKKQKLTLDWSILSCLAAVSSTFVWIWSNVSFTRPESKVNWRIVTADGLKRLHPFRLPTEERSRTGRSNRHVDMFRPTETQRVERSTCNSVRRDDDVHDMVKMLEMLSDWYDAKVKQGQKCLCGRTREKRAQDRVRKNERTKKPQCTSAQTIRQYERVLTLCSTSRRRLLSFRLLRQPSTNHVTVARILNC